MKRPKVENDPREKNKPTTVEAVPGKEGPSRTLRPVGPFAPNGLLRETSKTDHHVGYQPTGEQCNNAGKSAEASRLAVLPPLDETAEIPRVSVAERIRKSQQ
jgi:hypothetical protein